MKDPIFMYVLFLFNKWHDLCILLGQESIL